MGKGSARNEPCWCGSGKKYKKCHYGREQGDPLALHEVAGAVESAYDEKLCLAPASQKGCCSGKIVRAHSVPKSYGLKTISEKGHVYTFLSSPKAMVFNKVELKVVKVGINNASTFTGFCSYHDNMIFHSIEKGDFDFSENQLALLHYRAVAKEMFLKKCSANMYGLYKSLDRGKDVFGQMDIQMISHFFEKGNELALRDLQYKFDQIEKIVFQREGKIHGYVVVANQCPEVLCSSCFTAEWDIQGNIIQDVVGNYFSVLTDIVITSFSYRGVHAVIITWVEDGKDVVRKFVESLQAMGEDRIPDAICRIIFQHVENMFFSPVWWDSLGAKRQNKLIKIFRSTFDEEDKSYLPDDGEKLVDWKVVKQFRV